MKVIRRKIVGGVLVAVAASGLVFATAAPAAAHVAPHRHCLYTPNGWVPVAGGVSDKAPNLALEKFHVHVHTSVGVGADGVPGTSDDTIRRIGINQDAPSLRGSHQADEESLVLTSTSRRAFKARQAAGITAGSWYAWSSTHVGYELIGAGMLILAGGGNGKPLDYDELERWTRIGYERGMRSRKGER